MNKKLPIAVLVSGNGTNLQAIIDNCQNVDVKVVISDNANANAGVRAAIAHIPYIVDVPHSSKTDEYSKRLVNYIDMYRCQLIVLAGYMRILTPWFVDQFYGSIINIHPSLLPRHKGLNTHQRVIDAKDKQHGITIHYVTKELDSGPIILQECTSVQPEDNAETLERRIHALEHDYYPVVVDVLAAERIMHAPKSISLIDTKLNQALSE